MLETYLNYKYNFVYIIKHIDECHIDEYMNVKKRLGISNMFFF